MTARPSDEAALVIRVWREAGVTGFRGRVTFRVDAGELGETVVAVRSPEQVHAAVQEWLEEFLDGPGEPSSDRSG
jgi:hypothetical protein